MASLASERNWLLNPSTMKKVQQCRRLIRMEFGIKLHLTEKNLVDEMDRFARQSRSDTLARTWEELRNAVPELADAITQDPLQSAKRTYRGQAIPDSGPDMNVTDDPMEARARKKKVIYRGREVG